MRRRDGVKEKKSSVSLHTEVVFSISGFEGFRRRETEGGRERERDGGRGRSSLPGTGA